MGLPGQEYFAGTHVNPEVTWWEQSRAFIDYMHRTQAVVQNGKFVADMLYYSGTAVYNKTFNIDFEPEKDKQYFLQLEDVKDVGIAEVKINGKDKSILWTKQFRVEISKELQKGENALQIKVVNSWYNRVAGDQTFSGKKQYTKTNIDLKHDFRGRPIDEISLEPSGLIGPVIIKEAIN